MTTVEALKELFTALGGSEEDVENISSNPEMVHAIAEIAGSAIELPKVTSADEGDALIVDGSGKWGKAAIPSQLPAVTSEDAGDILAVDESGKWGKAEPSGGGGEIVYYTATTSGSMVTLSDSKIIQNIISDISLNKEVKLKIGNYIYSLTGDSTSYIMFSIVEPSSIAADSSTLSITYKKVRFQKDTPTSSYGELASFSIAKSS